MKIFRLLAVLLPTAFAGCGDAPLFRVSGTVTYGGQPLVAGMVWFDPDPSVANTPQGYARVKEGHFDTKMDGRGVRAGGYTIRVQGFDGKAGGESRRPLFDDYQEKRVMEAADAALTLEVPKK